MRIQVDEYVVNMQLIENLSNTIDQSELNLILQFMPDIYKDMMKYISQEKE